MRNDGPASTNGRSREIGSVYFSNTGSRLVPRRNQVAVVGGVKIPRQVGSANNTEAKQLPESARRRSRDTGK
jgi:hypothetical protein